MTKYRIAVRQTRQLEMTVEAECLEDAIETVWRLYEDGNIEFRPDDIRLTEVIPTGRIEELVTPATHRVIDLTTGEVVLVASYDECLKFIDMEHDYNLAITQ